jgi:ZIP family zinc transporter
VNKKILDPLLGFAGGVMIAASYWSLLAPALEMAEQQGQISWVPAAVGFLLGGVCLRLVDKLLPHLHLYAPIEEAEGISTTWRRTTLLVLAITLHNIPEGLAVGVAFGAVAHGLPTATLPAAIALAVGIGLQNFPEGMAVSMPLRREGVSRLKSFWYGQLSGIVPILPYALAFAAGAMIFVVVEEVIPESQRGGNADSATMGLMIGFTVMMILDVSLG